MREKCVKVRASRDIHDLHGVRVSCDIRNIRNAQNSGASLNVRDNNATKYSSTEKPKWSLGKKLTLVVGIIAVIAVTVLVFAIVQNNQLYDSDAQAGNSPYKTEEEVSAEQALEIPEGEFKYSLASFIEFDNGESSGAVFFENISANIYDMQLTITDDATGETLYKSGIIKPNQFVENITLDKVLTAGNYDATATVVALDPQTHEEVSRDSSKITISVLN